MFGFFWNGSLGLGFKVSGFGRIQAEASLAVTEFGRGTKTVGASKAPNWRHVDWTQR